MAAAEIGVNQSSHVPQLGDDAPPARCTASVTSFQPSTCARFHSPGAPGQPRPSRVMPVASEMIRPRWRAGAVRPSAHWVSPSRPARARVSGAIKIRLGSCSEPS